MISWGFVRGNKHQLGTKIAQERELNAASPQVDSSSSSHNDKGNAPYHEFADTAELRGPAPDLFSDIIDIEMTEAPASSTEQVAARPHCDSLETCDDEEGQTTYRYVGVSASSRPDTSA